MAAAHDFLLSFRSSALENGSADSCCNCRADFVVGRAGGKEEGGGGGGGDGGGGGGAFNAVTLGVGGMLNIGASSVYEVL